MFPHLFRENEVITISLIVSDPQTVCKNAGTCIVGFDVHAMKKTVRAILKGMDKRIAPPVKDWSRHYFFAGQYCAAVPYPRTVEDRIRVFRGFVDGIHLFSETFVTFSQGFIQAADHEMSCVTSDFDAIMHIERTSMDIIDRKGCKIVIYGIRDQKCTYYLIGIEGASRRDVLDESEKISKFIINNRHLGCDSRCSFESLLLCP